MKRLALMTFFFMFILAACGQTADEELEVTINFNTQGGNALSAITVNQNATSVNLPTPVREGYTFTGWFLSEALTEAFIISVLQDQEEVTLYAGWEEIPPIDDNDDDEEREVTVTFDTLLGSTIAPVVLNEGAFLIPPTEPTKEGFDFGGWYKDETFDTPFDFLESVDEDITLYARWLERFMVTFIADNQTVSLLDMREGFTVLIPETNPTKAGHTFINWYLDETFETVLPNNFVVTEDLTIYARFDINSYEISFSTLPAEAISAVSFEFGEVIVLPEDPEVEGYQFEGWYVNSSLTAPFTLETMPDENFTLYAKFLALVTITFYIDSEVYAVFEVVEGSNALLPEAPEREGYTFEGWVFGEVPFDENTVVNHNIFVDAVFIKETFTVNFETFEGSSIAPIELGFNEPFDFEVPTLNDQVFAGWYLDETLLEPLTFSTMPNESLTLYAKFITLGDVLTVADVINLEVEQARLENLYVIYTQTFMIFGEIYTFSYLQDTTGILTAVGDFGFQRGQRVSFEATFDYSALVPIITSINDETIVPHEGFLLPLEYIEVTLEELVSIDLSNPWSVGNLYKLEGLSFLDDVLTFFGSSNDTPIDVLVYNLSNEDDFDFEGPYLRGGFILLPLLEIVESHALLYDEDIAPLEEVALTVSEQLDLLVDFVLVMYQDTDVFVGTNLEFPEVDPFFNSQVTLEVLDNDEVYDSEQDEFLWVDEVTFVEFRVTLEKEGEMRTFDFLVRVVPTHVNPISSIIDNNLISGPILGTVMYVDEEIVIVQDETGIIVLDNYLYEEELLVGYEYLLGAVFYDSNHILVRGYVSDILYEKGENTVSWLVSECSLDSHDLLCGETPHLSFHTDVEGLLLYMEFHRYPYALLTPSGVFYLDARQAIDLSEFVGEYIQLEVIVGDYIFTFMNEAYLLYYLGSEEDITVGVEPSDLRVNQATQEITQLLNQVFRVEQYFFLPITSLSGVSFSYELDTEDSSIVNLDEYGMLAFLEEGTVNLIITLTYLDIEEEIIVPLVIENYPTTTIEDAILGETVYLDVVISTVIGGTVEYIATDETGIVIIDAYSITDWLEMGGRYVIKGTVNQEGNRLVLNHAQVELYLGQGTTPLEATFYDFDTLLTFDEPFDGIKYIYSEGYVAYGELTRALYDDLDGPFFDLFASSPYTSPLFDLDSTTRVRVFGFFTSSFMDTNIIVFEYYEIIDHE